MRNRPPICLGFDGSSADDFTVIRAETFKGFRFTPLYGADKIPTVWDPEKWDGRIPRREVDAAVAEIMATFTVARFYCDPHLWETQIDDWAREFGEKVVIQWPTNRSRRMYDALTRFREDLLEGKTTHSDDAMAKEHALHARKQALRNDTFVLGKPAVHMKIDIMMADILAHEAAADARATGWDPNSVAGKRIKFF